MAARKRQGWGSIRRLPSGRWHASYVGPDGKRHNAPDTYAARMDAEGYLARVRDRIAKGEWRAHATQPAGVPSLAEYADAWIAGRPLKPRTIAHYRALLDQRIVPTLGNLRIDHIDPVTVRRWHADMDPSAPTIRAHAYGLLRTILGTAVADDLIPSNPCRIARAGSVRRAKTIRPATVEELNTIAAHMPDAYAALVLMAAWCAMRFGELAELRRRDVDLDRGVVRIRRAVVRVHGEAVIGTPKSTAGVRDVAIPPHLIPVLAEHLAAHVARGADSLVFPGPTGGHLTPQALYLRYFPARDTAGRPDLRFHDLRHTGAVLAATSGATIADLMARLGHSSPAMAMRYQHTAADRDRMIADALSKLAASA